MDPLSEPKTVWPIFVAWLEIEGKKIKKKNKEVESARWAEHTAWY